MGSNIEVSCQSEVDTNMRNGRFALSSGVRFSAPGRSVQLDIEDVRSADESASRGCSPHEMRTAAAPPQTGAQIVINDHLRFVGVRGWNLISMVTASTPLDRKAILCVQSRRIGDVFAESGGAT